MSDDPILIFYHHLYCLSLQHLHFPASSPPPTSLDPCPKEHIKDLSIHVGLLAPFALFSALISYCFMLTVIAYLRLPETLQVLRDLTVGDLTEPCSDAASGLLSIARSLHEPSGHDVDVFCYQTDYS